MRAHDDLHRRAEELAQNFSLDELRAQIEGKGIRVRRAPTGRFGRLTKFADYSGQARTITLYGELSESEEKCALAHEWLHVVH